MDVLHFLLNQEVFQESIHLKYPTYHLFLSVMKLEALLNYHGVQYVK